LFLLLVHLFLLLVHLFLPVDLLPLYPVSCQEQVILSGNNISNKGAMCMARAIEKCKILLQSLDLSQNTIGPKAATALGYALSCNSLLSTLHLGQNEIGPDGCIGFAQVDKL